MKIQENYPLYTHNTFRINVTTRWFFEYDSEESLRELLADEFFYVIPYLHIGRGSNLLFLRDYYDGIVLHSRITGIEVLQQTSDFVTIKVGAGVVWDELVAYCVERNWGGIENLSLIPGEVGAAAVQNIGAYGSEIKDSLVEVHAYDITSGEKKVISNAECRFAYRESIFKTEAKDKYIVTHVVLKLSTHPELNLKHGNLQEVLSSDFEIGIDMVRDTIAHIRKNKLPDPEQWGNAGSFFKNPFVRIEDYNRLKQTYPEIPCYPENDRLVKVPAAWLIEQSGWKGKQWGHAAVYEKQPLIIINKGKATGNEVVTLAEMIQRDVKQKFSIKLEPEVLYVS